MGEYIEREAVLDEYDRQHNGPPGGARKIIAEFPSADVVLRDCYNAILWENDIMRKQLAEIGKSFGEKMDDVQKAVRGRWEWNDHNGYYYCSNCNSVSPREDQEGEYCDTPLYCHKCGAKMDLE